MMKCETAMKSLLVAAVLLALTECGLAAEKLATCCETVSRQEIKEPILDYMVQRKRGACVDAIIFQTEKGLFCSYVRAPWVRSKIAEFERSRRKPASLATPSPSTDSAPSLSPTTTSPSSSSPAPSASAPPPSLLSIITSSSSSSQSPSSQTTGSGPV